LTQQPSLASESTGRAERAAFDTAVDHWAATRHARVQAFVDANFRLPAALRLHRRALGLDLLRAPGNVALVPIFLLAQLGAGALKLVGAGRAGRWLAHRRLFFETTVARELAWRLHTQLLELPYEDGGRRSEGDSLAQVMLAEVDLSAPPDMLPGTVARHRDDPALRARLATVLESYTGARTAAAELVNNLLLAGAGATMFKQLTPGALSLGPLLAGAVAQHFAIVGFPLGATLGSLWYGIFAAEPSFSLLAGMTAGLMAFGAVLTAFAGVIGDPLQRALGLHQRRLHSVIDALALQLKGDSEAALKVRDHYAARIFDVADALGAAARFAG
jgi:hypothetical protein